MDAVTSLAGTIVRTFRPGDEAAIRRIMEASLAVDALPGIEASDIDDAITRLPADPGGTVVALEGDWIVGYCTPRLDDLTVHPDHRRRGHGRRLVAAALALVRAQGLPYLQLHGPTHLTATRAFIAAVGLRHHSSLWRFELPAEVDVPAAIFPASVSVRPFDPADPLEPYVALLNAAFADHPTPLSWTVEGIRHVHELADFDPSRVRVVRSADDPARLVAFAVVSNLSGEPARGEVKLIGVLPGWRGHGLGTELLRWGIGSLRARGATVVTLSVEALNARATRIYRAAGFVPTIEWPHYILET